MATVNRGELGAPGDRALPRRVVCGRRTFYTVALLGLLTLGCSQQQAEIRIPVNQISAPATDLKLLDLAGGLVNPFQGSEADATVFVFIRPDCPISNRYAPEVRRLSERFKTVQFWVVYPDSDLSVDEIQKHLAEYRFGVVALRDPKLELVDLCQAGVTPEAAVFDQAKKLVYRGRIDDRFVAFGKSRPAPTQLDLADVLTALSEKEPLLPRSQPAIGCPINRAKLGRL
jgi:hypothetical protein